MTKFRQNASCAGIFFVWQTFAWLCFLTGKNLFKPVFMAFPLLFTLFFYGFLKVVMLLNLCLYMCFVSNFILFVFFLLLNICFRCYFVFMFFTSVMPFMFFVISSMKKYIVKSMFSHRYVPLYNTKRYLSDGSLQIQCKYIWIPVSTCCFCCF